MCSTSLNAHSITNKGLQLYRDRQTAIDRHDRFYRNSMSVTVSAKDNRRAGDGSSWGWEHLKTVASLPGLVSLTIDLPIGTADGRTEHRTYDNLALETLANTIVEQQGRGFAGKQFCLSMKDCGRMTLPLVRKLADCWLKELDVTNCDHHPYGPDGATAIAKALESPEWAKLEKFEEYVHTSSEPSGLFRLSLAALKHEPMKVFRLNVEGQDPVVYEALRCQTDLDFLPIEGFVERFRMMFAKVAGPDGSKSRKSMKKQPTRVGIDLVDKQFRSSHSLDKIDDLLRTQNLFDLGDEEAVGVWKHPVHFALGMANRCDCLVSRLSAYSEDCGEYAGHFQQAATELLDECNDMFEAEKVLLDTGHRFIKGEDPLNYALRHEFVHFVSNRWTKRYTKELWYSVDPRKSSTTDIGLDPVKEFTRTIFTGHFVKRIVATPLIWAFTVLCVPLIFLLYLLQVVVGPWELKKDSDRLNVCRRCLDYLLCCLSGGILWDTPESREQLEAEAKRKAKGAHLGKAFNRRSSKPSVAEEAAVYTPGRWARRLFMTWRLLNSTAVCKYYFNMWLYFIFLLLIMLLGFRSTSGSMSTWNVLDDVPGEVLIWIYGFGFVLQEIYEIRNRYAARTFLADSASIARSLGDDDDEDEGYGHDAEEREAMGRTCRFWRRLRCRCCCGRRRRSCCRCCNRSTLRNIWSVVASHYNDTANFLGECKQRSSFCVSVVDPDI